MLKQLYINNFTLIEELDICFNSGFSVITGETGAGKSIILGALGLLLGQRADSKSVKAGAAKCTVEAHFDLSRYDLQSFFEDNDIDYDGEDTILRRELSANGKSRAFINDTPVSLVLMRTLGEQLIDIHSQHQNLLLQKEDFQMNVIDIIAKDRDALADYANSFDDYNRKLAELDELKARIEQNRKDEEFMRFRYTELGNANLMKGEQEELELEAETLSHSEEIKSALYDTDKILSGDERGVVANVKTAAANLHSIEEVYPSMKDIASRIDSVYVELKDVAQEVGNSVEDIDFDPARLDNINVRLDTIYALEQKYSVETVDELIDIWTDLKSRLDNLDNSDEEVDFLTTAVEAKRKACERKAKTLTGLRKVGAKVIEEEMGHRLVSLGIPNVQFKISFEPKNLAANGGDTVSFLFSANKNVPLQPVSQVASGGEIARVMLSLKAMISGAVKLPTIIFDEIDTGVSGKIAEKMALIMEEMGHNDRQVISITHLPQIAAHGSTHYKVYKEDTDNGTTSYLRMLKKDERIKEIAQMLSGDNISEAAINNAKELLK